MEAKMIAYCGIACSSCDAFLATQTGDQIELERVAVEWRTQYDPAITAESIVCKGCRAESGPLAGFCSMCPIRVCATDRGEESCAYCDDYPCDRLVPHFEHAPQMRDLLDGLRRQYLTAA
jgi:thiamine biosynthesis protein ThiC